jgi:hypothetical protein
MNQATCQLHVEEALAKASAARTANVRTAYLELASFYQRKLDDLACFAFRPEAATHCFI